MKKLKKFIIAGLITFGAFSIYAQTLLDISTGTSQQDNFAFQATLRSQITARFRAGIQFQYGLPRYRFVSAMPFRDKGYSTTLAVPLTFRINDNDDIQLSLFIKTGMRFQGIIDPDENNRMDSVFRSTAITFEPGLLVNIPFGEKMDLQSGITFPLFYEVVPTLLFENQTTLLHTGISYKTGNYSQAFIKANMGSAWGANGDSQKFLWSAQVGLRFTLGKNKNKSFNSIIESSL